VKDAYFGLSANLQAKAWIGLAAKETVKAAA